MKSAATFRTFGHRIKATIVRRLPKIPTIMIIIVAAAASVRSGRENLEENENMRKPHEKYFGANLPTQFTALILKVN